MKEIIFLNKEFVAKEKAKLSVLEPGLLYGWGVFETMRAFGHRIIYLKQHLRRIKESCRKIDIRCSCSIGGLNGIIRKAVAKSDFDDAYVRLSIYKSGKDADVVVIVRKYKPYTPREYLQGFRGCISELKQTQNPVLAKIKSTNYLMYQLAYAQAKKRGFDEALITNAQGYITEGTRSNVFLVKGKKIFTPSLECGCLNGITRQVVFDLAKTYHLDIAQERISVQGIRRADEAFLTNSLIGIMPLVSLEKQIIGRGLAGGVTAFFMQKYKDLLEVPQNI